MTAEQVVAAGRSKDPQPYSILRNTVAAKCGYAESLNKRLSS